MFWSPTRRTASWRRDKSRDQRREQGGLWKLDGPRELAAAAGPRNWGLQEPGEPPQGIDLRRLAGNATVITDP